MSAPNLVEEQLLEDFRNRVSDILKTKEQHRTSYLVRWLRARDLDLNKAEDMLRASLIWREENNIDKVLEVQFDSNFKKEFPYYINGIDKHSNPVILVPIGKWDLRKVVAQGKTQEFKLYVNFIFEDICRAIKKRNETRDRGLYPVTQFTTIFDWKGYSYLQLCSIKAVKNILYAGGIYEAHYPEVLCRCFFVNCPSFFNVLLSMIKQLLAARTYEKISVYGSNRVEWEQACREIIDVDQLSVILKPLA